jgi:hypothetical protein
MKSEKGAARKEKRNQAKGKKKKEKFKSGND